MMILTIWLGLSVAAGAAATSRGRNGFGWFLLSVLLSPLIGLILVLVMPNLRTERLIRTQHAEMMEALGHPLPRDKQAIMPASYDAGWIIDIVVIILVLGVIGYIAARAGGPQTSELSTNDLTAERSYNLPEQTPQTEAFANAIRKRDSQ